MISTSPRTGRFRYLALLLFTLSLFLGCVESNQPTPTADNAVDGESSEPTSTATSAATATPAPTATPDLSSWNLDDFDELGPYHYAFFRGDQSGSDLLNYRVLNQLVRLESDFPGCTPASCDTSIAATEDNDGNVAFVMVRQDGSILFPVDGEGERWSGEGQIDLQKTEVIPLQVTVDGEYLRPVMFFDFDVAESGALLAAEGVESVDTMGWINAKGEVVSLLLHSFTDGIAQVQIREPRLLLGEESSIVNENVEGAELVMTVDRLGNQFLGYYSVEDAGARVGRIRLEDGPSRGSGEDGVWQKIAGEWRWVGTELVDTSEVPETPIPTPTVEATPYVTPTIVSRNWEGYTVQNFGRGLSEKELSSGIYYSEPARASYLVGNISGVEKGLGYVEGDDEEWYVQLEVGGVILNVWIGEDEEKVGVSPMGVNEQDRTIQYPGMHVHKSQEVSVVREWMENNLGAPIVMIYDNYMQEPDTIIQFREEESCINHPRCFRTIDVTLALSIDPVLDELEEGTFDGDLPEAVTYGSFKLPGYEFEN